MKALDRASGRSFWFGILAVLGFLIASRGYRMHMFGLQTSFMILRVAFGVAVVGTLLGLLVLILGFINAKYRRWKGYVGLALSVSLLVPMCCALYRGKTLPRIHDITTDWEDVPQFTTLVTARAGATNSLTYEGAELTRQQKAAYPDIHSFEIDQPLTTASATAEKTAQALGWTIAAVNRGAYGIAIEATETSLWFGFVDDIVIRLKEKAGDKTQVDVRSVSRVGVSDMGVNAGRIRKYMKRLAAAGQAPH